MGDVPCGWQAGKGPTNFLSTAVQMRFIYFPGGALAWAAIGCQVSSLVSDWWSSPPLLRALVCLRPLGHSHPRKEPSWARCAVADVALRGSGGLGRGRGEVARTGNLPLSSPP